VTFFEIKTNIPRFNGPQVTQTWNWSIVIFFMGWNIRP